MPIKKMSMSEAISMATSQAMENDDDIFVIGEGVTDPKSIFGTTIGLSEKFGIFARFNQWDNYAGSNSGTAKDTEKEQWDVGINYWPHEDVVIKDDYQYQNNDDGKEQNGLNLGIGYQF